MNIYTLRVEFFYHFISSTNVIAVRVGSNVELKVLLGDAQIVQIIDDFCLIALVGNDSRTFGVAGITAGRVIGIFSRVYHTELAVAFQDDSFCIGGKRKIMNPGVRRRSLDSIGRQR